MRWKTVCGISAFSAISVLLLVLTIGVKPVLATSARFPQFWFLGIEYDIGEDRNSERMISELLKYQNWNNSTEEYVSHIDLLSDHMIEDVFDEAKPCLRGFPYRQSVESEMKDFLGSASPGDVVLVDIGCHGSVGSLDIGWSYDELSDLLSSGGLKSAFVTIIIDACYCGSSIDDGDGGSLGASYRNILCACGSNELSCGVFCSFVSGGFGECEDQGGDGWASAAEVFAYAKPMTEEVSNFSHPVCYLDISSRNVPLVQRDNAKPFPDPPPVISVISPQNASYAASAVPLTFSVNEPVQWMSCSLDYEANVTILGNTTLEDLSEGKHAVIVYACDVPGNVGAYKVCFTKGLPPTAEFSWSPLVPRFGEYVVFDASYSVPNGGVMMQYDWDYGDGCNARNFGSACCHVYVSPGTYTVTLNVTDSELLWDSVQKQVQISSCASVDFKPVPLNLGWKGGCLSCYIKLPEGLNCKITDIDVSTVLLNGTFHAETESVVIDNCTVGVSALLVSFNRTAVSDFLSSHNVTTGNVTFAIVGQLYDGTLFVGSETIKVRMPGDINLDNRVNMKDIGLAASAFGRCPEETGWNSVADENEDNRIDLRDIAMIARHFGEIGS